MGLRLKLELRSLLHSGSICDPTVLVGLLHYPCVLAHLSMTGRPKLYLGPRIPSNILRLEEGSLLGHHRLPQLDIECHQNHLTESGLSV